MAKITKATFKSFIKKNEKNLFIRVGSTFDGMVDCVMPNPNAQFNPLVRAERVFSNNLGYQGVWLVNGSRDSFEEYNQNGMIGIRVYNCCGSFVVAKKAVV